MANIFKRLTEFYDTSHDPATGQFDEGKDGPGRVRDKGQEDLGKKGYVSGINEGDTSYDREGKTRGGDYDAGHTAAFKKVVAEIKVGPPSKKTVTDINHGIGAGAAGVGAFPDWTKYPGAPSDTTGDNWANWIKTDGGKAFLADVEKFRNPDQKKKAADDAAAAAKKKGTTMANVFDKLAQVIAPSGLVAAGKGPDRQERADMINQAHEDLVARSGRLEEKIAAYRETHGVHSEAKADVIATANDLSGVDKEGNKTGFDRLTGDSAAKRAKHKLKAFESHTNDELSAAQGLLAEVKDYQKLHAATHKAMAKSAAGHPDMEDAVAHNAEMGSVAIASNRRLLEEHVADHERLLKLIAKAKTAKTGLIASSAILEFAGNAQVLRDYWENGKGAELINWGSEGDLTRCHDLLVEHADFSSEDAWGYCERRAEQVYGESNRSHDIKAGQYPKGGK